MSRQRRSRTRTTDERWFRKARLAVASTFAMHAVAAGSLGPWMPRLKSGAGLDAGGLGLALSAYAIGLVAGTRLADPLVRRFGGRPVVRVGAVLLASGLSTIPFARGLATLSGAFAGFGVVSGALDVTMNLEAVAVEARSGRRVMSGLHGTWSVSLLAGAAIASASIAAETPITVALPLLALLLVGASLFPLRWLPRPADRDGGKAEDPSTDHRRSWTKRVLLLGGIGFASFLTEGVTADWGAVYVREVTHASAGIAGTAVVAFSAGMALSRFLGDRLATRVSPSTIARGGASFAAMALATALLVGGTGAAIAAFAAIGLGLGPVVPFAFSAAGTLRLRGASALSLVVTSGYVGSIIGPLVLGFVADRVGLRIGFGLLVLTCAGIAIAAPALRDGTVPPRVATDPA